MAANEILLRNVRIPVRFVFSFLLAIVLIGALELSEWVVLVFGLPVPWFDKNLPYLAPFVIAVFIFNIRLAGRSVRLDLSELALALVLLFFIISIFGIELAHLMLEGGEFRGGLHLGYFWFAVFVLTLMSFHYRLPDCPEQVARATVVLSIGMATVLVLAQLLSPGWGVALPGFVSAQLFDSAQIAYMAVFGLTVSIFYCKSRSIGELLLINVLGSCVLIYAILTQRLTGPVLLLLGVLGLKVLGLQRTRRTQIMAVLMATLAGGLFFLTSSRENGEDPTLVGLVGGTVYHDEVGFLHGDILSSYARRETIYASLQLFLESPIFGVGMSRVSEVRSLIYGLHSNFFSLLAGAGLLGMSLFLLPFIMVTSNAYRRDGPQALALPALVFCTMLLTPKVVWWWAVALYLLATHIRNADSTIDKPISVEIQNAK
jgi:hypothetical protein